MHKTPNTIRFFPKTGAAICAVLMLQSATALADKICDQQISDIDIIGEYTIQMGPGTMVVETGRDPRVHVVKQRTGSAIIAIDQGRVILFSDDIAQGGKLEILLTRAKQSDKDTDFLDGTEFSTLTVEELGQLHGCKNADDLPQVTGVGSVSGQANGFVIPNSVRLVFHKIGDKTSASGRYFSTFSPPTSERTITISVKLQLDEK